MKSDNSIKSLPSSEELKKELNREKSKASSGNSFFRNTIFAIVVVAAIVAIVTTLYFPVMKVTGSSMTPTIEDGSLVVAVKQELFDRGDICAFYSGSSVLCKRIIAFGGEVVDIDEYGVVYIDNVPLDEPYLTATDFGNTDIKFPYVVPAHSYFVMGDNRSTSIDSRNTRIGAVSEGQVIGKLIFRFWPFDAIGTIE